MSSQDLENSHPTSVMSEIEGMSLEHEPQEEFASDKGEALTADDSASHEKKEMHEGYSSQFEAFKKDFDLQPDPESKLKLAIDFLEASLAQGGTPHFRSFWEVRRLCLPLFKETISPQLRSHLWTKYSEISNEARRLKEILDEQSAFAVEQIEIAIQALEQDLSPVEEQVEKPTLSEEIPFPLALKANLSLYQRLQKGTQRLECAGSAH